MDSTELEPLVTNRTGVPLDDKEALLFRDLVTTLIHLNEDCLLFEIRDDANNRSLFVEITTFIKEDSVDG